MVDSGLMGRVTEAVKVVHIHWTFLYASTPIDSNSSLFPATGGHSLLLVEVLPSESLWSEPFFAAILVVVANATLDSSRMVTDEMIVVCRDWFSHFFGSGLCESLE